MTKRVAFDLRLQTAEDIVRRVLRGQLGLPDFQRRFEWSTADVKAFLSTALGGLPSGSIMVARNSSLGLMLRELEDAPKIDSLSPDVEALLDGQQRVTALFHAMIDTGPDQYYVNFNALERGASVLEDDVIVSRRRGGRLPQSLREFDLVPAAALRNEHAFFGWLNSPSSPRDAVRQWSHLFGEKLQALDRYQIPVTELAGELDLATVAQVFERTNKWGQRLDAFDLLVARLQQVGWSLRSAWDEAQLQYPAISRVFGSNGLAAISAIALREVGDVRRNAVLALRPFEIERQWEEATHATDQVARLLLREGVRKPELLAYDSVATTMIAAAMEDVPVDLLATYYWLAATNRWHEAASNTRVVSDFRDLRQGLFSPDFPREPPAREDFEASTRRSSRALWAAMLGAMLTLEPRDLVTGAPITSADPEAEDAWELVPMVKGGARVETSSDVPARLRTAAQLFAVRGVGTRLRREGFVKVLLERRDQPSLLLSDSLGADLESQLLPRELESNPNIMPVRALVEWRAGRIRGVVYDRLRWYPA